MRRQWPAQHGDTAASARYVGTTIGPYKLLQLIGEGGFGAVYRAEQEKPIRRRVALKLIKLGMEGASVTSELDQRVGSELRPDLEVVRRLGEGASARVYLAREPALQRLVAVKVLRPDLAADSVVRRRFEREAQSAACISHAHVTAIHRVGRLADGVPYMVMEFVDGRTVRDVLEARGAFDLAEARGLLAAVASALAAAHEKGIVHRDVRPANVFVENRTGRAVLGDFGIATLLDSGATPAARLTAAGVRMGEVRYMSPEQVRGEPVTEQSDVYALGILAYEVLVGRGPYEASSNAQILAGHLELTPSPLRELRPDMDPALARLVEGCLAKDPVRRPTAREVAAAVSPLAGAAPAPGAAPEPTGPLALFLDELRHRRIYRVLVAYGAIALAVLGGAQSVYEAFDLPGWSYRVLVAATLAGFPVALVLGWLYDITAGGIRRTGTRPAALETAHRARALKWAGLGFSVVLAATVGWVLLRGR